MKRFLVLLLCSLGFGHSVWGEPPKDPLPLWPGGAVPGTLGNDPAHDVPTLTPFWPEPTKATGAAIVICPGGAYGGLAEHEGRDYALWLAERGIAGFVLKYRLGSKGYRHPAMLFDVQRAIRLVRFHAPAWRLDPARIGVMGSSAGGHLASTAMTHFDPGNAHAVDPVDRAGCRPDLGILCYPVITMGSHTHAGSKKNLLGPEPAPELVALLSNETQVTAETPPCFLWHTVEDDVVSVRNAIDFAEALLKHRVSLDLHLYQTGRHGLGLGVRNYQPGATEAAKLLPWTHELETWLRVQKFVK